MKIKKIPILLIAAVIIIINNNPLESEAVINDYTGESIQYAIQPVGKSEYNNRGTVDFKGVKANLITLKSRILFVNVAEKIFYDPESLLPYKTERTTTSGLWGKEYRTEEYDQKKFTVLIRKFKGAKLVKEKLIKAGGPIQNMNLLLFYLRKQPDLKIGWHFTVNVLDELKLFEFDLKLLSIDEIAVPAGKFQAYYFKSVPDKFEILIEKSSRRAPIKVKLKGIVDCTILMKGYRLRK